MAVGGQVYTYPDVARRESLLDIVNMLDPTDTQLLSGIKQSSATNTLHEWIQESLETVGDNAMAEGADAPADVAGDPTRVQNVTQIFSKTARITGSETADSLKRVGGNRMSREITKKMKALKNDTEFALLRGTIASGVASSSAASARRLKGVKAFVTTNAPNYSGVSLTETILNDIFQLSWDQGANIDAVYTPMKGKRRISTFTAGSAKNIDAKDRRLVNSVNIYESDAAKLVKIFPHRHVTVTGDYGTTATPGFDVLALQEDTWATAWYRKTFTKPVASVGDYEAKQILHELTLEALQEKANVQAKVLF